MLDRSKVRAAISDAYYDARNARRTMEQAADDATDRVLALEATPSRTTPARSTDPETSHKATAAVTVKAGTQRHRLLAAFALEAATEGLTDEEAADLAEGVPYRSEFAKRCSELRVAGHIEVIPGATRAGVAGHQRIVSRITDAGRAALAAVS